jgi:adenylosuccinate lyase
VNSISPLDGRYADRVSRLRAYFPEEALMAYRCRIELRYLLAQEGTGLWPPLTAAERTRVDDALARFDDADFQRIKEIETRTRHDVKACELFLRQKLGLEDPNRIHFGLTSEDVNNLAYSLSLQDHLREVQAPLLAELCLDLAALVEKWRDIPFPARTHGQKASPTTAGKELAVFLSRLLRQCVPLRSFRFSGKLSGATGTYAALGAAFPGYDWVDFAGRFIEGLGLQPNLVTTQIEDHDTWAEYFDRLRRIANILIDLDRDMWLYISHGYLAQAVAPDQVGSSTMPHKVNPIHFENSEGNLELAVAQLAFLADKLCRSRMQRDLSDSTVERNIGVALAHLHLAVQETLVGLRTVDIDRQRCREEIECSPELLAEPVQTILRTAGIADPYERLRSLTRGRAVTAEEIGAFLDGLEVDDDTRRRLKSLRPIDYVGEAPRLCDRVVARARKELGQ